VATTTRVGDLLLEAGVITRAQLNEALRHQSHAGGRLGSCLVELGFIDEKTLATFLAKHHSIPAVTAASIDRIRPEVLEFVPAQMAERLRVIPIREDAGKLWVAMTDPTDKHAITELEKSARLPIRAMVSPELLMQYALEKHYKVRRKPRVVEVRTTGSDLLYIEDGSRQAPEARAVSREEDPIAPVYGGLPSTMAVDALDAVTGYIDESPQVAPKVTPGPSRMTMATLPEVLVAASTDESVLDAAVRFLAQDIPRVWMFLLKNGELWSWGGRGIESSTMTGAHVAMTELPLVAQALASGEVLVGRLQPSALGRLAAPLGAQGELLGLVLPVRIGKHAVGVIFGLDVPLDVLRRKPELDKLALKLDQALHINYLRRLLLTV
jgi:hypothetical protein